MVFLWVRPAAADSRHYVVNAGSSITSVCNRCATAPAPPEPLSGTFDVTLLPVSNMFDVAAITNLSLSSKSTAIGGNGFLQRLGPDRQAMVLDALVNGEKVLFTSGRRQHADSRDITMILSSTRAGAQTHMLVISASAVDDPPADADGDGVADMQDNCPLVANRAQSDSDGDRVGDACDACAGSTAGSMVTASGCSVDQLCPCDASASGEAWQSQRDYLRCVARATRTFRREGQVSRNESLRIIRRAARTGCGRTVVALR